MAFFFLFQTDFHLTELITPSYNSKTYPLYLRFASQTRNNMIQIDTKLRDDIFPVFFLHFLGVLIAKWKKTNHYTNVKRVSLKICFKVIWINTYRQLKHKSCITWRAARRNPPTRKINYVKLPKSLQRDGLQLFQNQGDCAFKDTKRKLILIFPLLSLNQH